MTTPCLSRRTPALIALAWFCSAASILRVSASDAATPPPATETTSAIPAAPASTEAEEKKEKKPSETEVIELESLSVSGAKEGMSQAMALQKIAVSTKVVVAADAFGDVVTLSAFCVGATPGGSQDIRYFRDVVSDGGFPHPATITAEGLFSEHDLPLREAGPSREMLVLTGEGMPAAVLTRPDVKYLAQIGFSSGLDAATWKRDPVNLIAVVDKSGSMSGPPLELVKESLRQVLRQLGPDDQLAVVLYGDQSHVHLAPTRTNAKNRDAIAAAIDAIESAGSTNMEEGLRVGFELARASQKNFHGRTRVMQFTDERPNVGDTSAEGFMGMMETASRDGIGQTTIGVGVQFGAELAAKISTVRGGNLFFFPDAEAMTMTFTEEFDTFVTELVHDLDVMIRPAPGLRIAGVYGVPGEVLKWEGGRNVRFSVTTIFLSRKKGAIYVAFAPEDEDLPARPYVDGTSLAELRLAYREVGTTKTKRSRLQLPLVANSEASVGLQRGQLLVGEYLSLKSAMKAHLVENNQEQAFTVLGDLRDALAARDDESLRGEREMVEKLFAAVAKLAGHGESVGAAPATAVDEDDEEVVELGGSGFPNADATVDFPRRAMPRRHGRR